MNNPDKTIEDKRKEKKKKTDNYVSTSRANNGRPQGRSHRMEFNTYFTIK
jgi:hypothetical protein